MSLSAESLGDQLPVWSAVPFLGLLVAITVLEIAARRWWDHLASKAIVALALAAPAAIYLLAGYGSAGGAALLHTTSDYVSFIILLTALYVIAGGIQIRGSLAGTPPANTTLLAIGAILANLIGTTGAAMLLIRPLLRANEERKHKAHLVVAFILVVANCGGLLTPLGDPPLYLGFLRGVPFDWTLRLWLPWLVANCAILFIFNIVDRIVLRREAWASRGEPLLDELVEHEPLRVRGLRNLAFLAGIIGVILASGSGLGNGGAPWPFGVREVLMAGLAVGSYALTPRPLYIANHFSFRPMASVAIIFLGIFVTMTAPLLVLNAHSSQLGVTEPWAFYWATGGLSAFLDNAPTYLSLASVAAGQSGIPTDGMFLAELVSSPVGAEKLAAISVGAVFMGSLTYVGNGPNLMVKEIAEHRGVRMPNFLIYMLMAVAVMAPVLVVAAYLLP